MTQKKENYDGKNIAAIDIGSNAARLIIKSVKQREDGEIETKKLQFLRVPLRLGSDVFSDGKISKEKAKDLCRLLKAYQKLMKIYDVADYYACATSAMRDAKNGKVVIREVEKKSGINIRIIDGTQEAKLVYLKRFENSKEQLSKDENYIYVDVGGGSTEINLICRGELIESDSYNIGTVRMLAGKVEQKQMDGLLADMERLRETLVQNNPAGQATPTPMHIIGSGGNINKLYSLTAKKKDEKRVMTVAQLKTMYDNLKSLDVQARQDKYNLKPDRADVIVPAAEIFLTIAKGIGATDIFVPEMGLCDGLIDAIIDGVKL